MESIASPWLSLTVMLPLNHNVNLYPENTNPRHLNGFVRSNRTPQWSPQEIRSTGRWKLSPLNHKKYTVQCFFSKADKVHCHRGWHFRKNPACWEIIPNKNTISNQSLFLQLLHAVYPVHARKNSESHLPRWHLSTADTIWGRRGEVKQSLQF
jgi:hypothetical protein